MKRPDVRSIRVFIYALCEPTTGEVRYVGKSSAPEARMAAHRVAGALPVRKWFGELAASGLKPVLRILSEVEPGQDVDRAERSSIAEHSRGGNLLNCIGMTGNRPCGVSCTTPVERRRSEGQRLLRAVLSGRGKAIDLAFEIGVRPSVVSRWLAGRQSPVARLRFGIEALYGIPPLSWDEAWIDGAEAAA